MVLKMLTVSVIRCPDPTVPGNGRIIEEASYEDYRVGAVVHFSCFPGHKLQGEQSIVCTDSGVWSTPSPICQYHLIFLLLDITNGKCCWCNESID